MSYNFKKYSQRSIASIVIITFFFSLFISDILFVKIIYAEQLNPAQKTLNRGMKKFEEGNYNDAIRLLNKAADKLSYKEKTDLTRAFFHIALSWHLLGNNKKAQEVLKNNYKMFTANSPDPEFYSPKTIKWFNYEMIKIKGVQEIEAQEKKEREKRKREKTERIRIAKENFHKKYDKKIEDKSIFKKWWFWALVAGVTGGGVVMATGGDGGGGNGGGGGGSATNSSGGDAVIGW